MGASDIFIWQPDYTDIRSGINNNTSISVFESGKEQRRSKWAKPKYTSNLSFQRYIPQRGVTEEIFSFIKGMEGQYGFFWLPSFKRETFLIADYTGGTTLYVDQNERFSATTNAHGNYLYITDGTNHEVKQISSLSGSPEIIVIASDFTNSYLVETAIGKKVWIQVAYKARFNSDSYSMDITADFVRNSKISFIEVF